MPQLCAVVVTALNMPWLFLQAILATPGLQSFELHKPPPTDSTASPSLRCPTSNISTKTTTIHPLAASVRGNPSLLSGGAGTHVPRKSYNLERARSVPRTAWLLPVAGAADVRSTRPTSTLSLHQSSLRCQACPRSTTLALELVQTSDAEHEPLWPTNVQSTFFWPELRRSLSIAYPHLEDQIYSHLPATLSSLALRCWPRQYMHRYWPQ